MRKLLIKLVAIETALVGWLSYWLFLVYANNPTVAAELSSSLQRFPQLSFSTIDIAVMVIIAALAVTLAFKFQRGLRPGIRLERALQMLESLMKRNLVLEAQVAELKIEKSHTPPIITSLPTPASSASEPRSGSWEKAFRTPLEAGPPLSSRNSATATDPTPFGYETGIPPRIEPKTQPSTSMSKSRIVIANKSSEPTSPPRTMTPETTVEKPAFTSTPAKPPSSTWEDNPKFIGESKGVMTTSSARKAPTASDSGGLRQPYIPAPAVKPPPPSIVVGPTTPPVAKIPPISNPPKITARPTGRPIPKPGLGITTPPPPAADISKTEPLPPTPVIPPILFSDKPPTTNDPSTSTSTPAPGLQKPSDVAEKSDDMSLEKLTAPTRKRLSPGSSS